MKVVSKYFLLFYFIFIYTKYSFSEEKKDDHAHKETTTHTPIPPLPRFILMPDVSFSDAPSRSGGERARFQDHRYWYILIISTWNQRSSEITAILNSNKEDLTKRDVFILGLFSQDTIFSVEKWRRLNRPQFLNAFASRDLLDSLGNPKIPSIWLVGQGGEILQQYEMPTIEDVKKSIQKVQIMTQF